MLSQALRSAKIVYVWSGTLIVYTLSALLWLYAMLEILKEDSSISANACAYKQKL